MIRTPRPNLVTSAVFADCCSSIEDADRKQRLFRNAGRVSAAGTQYSELGLSGRLSSFDASLYEPLEATQADFDWLYDVRLVKSSPGRRHYRQIRDGNSGRCALCNVRDATTLDHHLPKSQFPVLAVTPDNLLPACDACNHVKLANTRPILNAYFDELGSSAWLSARVIESTPYTLEYYVVPDPDWSPTLADRAIGHFDLLELSVLYAKQAVRMLAGMRKAFADLHDAGGATGVRAHVQWLAASYRDAEPNGWEAAILTAAAASDWFCDGGFRV